jgi:HPt (histidine-containing phosphotransfer) domain-containing protein
MCANISAHRLTDIASRIETAGKACSTDITDLVTSMEDEFRVFNAALEKMFPELFGNADQTAACAEAEMLPEAMQAITPEFFRRLKQEMVPIWKEITEVFLVDDVSSFAEKLKQIAEEYHSEALACYSCSLEEAVRNYDVDKMEELLELFPEMLDELSTKAIVV